MKGFVKQFTALFTDAEWDADPVKIFGFIILVVGLVGWWFEKQDFQWVVYLGGGMLTTGKFSKQG